MRFSPIQGTRTPKRVGDRHARVAAVTVALAALVVMTEVIAGPTTWAAAGHTSSLRSTATTVTCASPVTVGASSSCTATVTDTATGTASTPTGTVTFTTTGVSGSWSSGSCTLSSGWCSSSFTATSAGTATVTASYGGDTAHKPSKGSTAITVTARSTATTVGCSPASMSVGQSTTCTATVTDTAAGTPASPTGTVTFTSSGSGSFSSSSCTLASGTCDITYTPAGAGTTTVDAVYNGDATHASSSGSTSVTAAQGKPTVLVALGPGGISTPNPSTYDIAPCIVDVHVEPDESPIGICDNGAGVAVAVARLTDSTGTPLSGKTITFNFQQGGSTGTTDGNGVATVTLTAVYPAFLTHVGGGWSLGYTAVFAGDNTYAPSTASWPPAA